MYEFNFEGYSKEQCDAYLARIGAEFDGETTIENLNRLIVCHQQTVPFENLAVFENWGTVNLAPDALFQKVVTEHRGGFCFELNGAFALLLKGLGYDAVGVMARIGIPFLGTLLPLHHRGILVTIDGKEHYCDVGLGGPKPEWAVPLSGEKDCVNGKSFWIEDTDRGWKMLKNDYKGSDGSCVIFAPIAMLPFDFEGNCTNLIESGNSIFHQNRLVNITTPTGFIALENHTLTIQDGEEKTARDYEEAEFPQILEQYFGISYPGK